MQPPTPYTAGVQGPPTFEQISGANATGDPGPRNPRSRKLAIVGSVFGLGAVALAGLAFITGGNDLAGGANAPDAAVTEMADAISDGDALAAVGLLAPDELSGADAFVEKLIPYIAELSDEFGSDPADFSSDDIEFDIAIEAVDVEVQPRGEHAAVVSFAIVGEVTVDGSNSSLISDELLAQTGADADFTTDFDSRVRSDDFDGEDFELVTVELDGAWYISPFLSAGHAWVESEGLQGGEFERVGEERRGAAADPVAAVERYYDATSRGDTGAIAAALGGGEGRFFQVFDDALDASGVFDDFGAGGFVDEADFDYTLTELDDGRVEIDDVELSFDDGFGEMTTITMTDGCGSIESYGERARGCFSELFPPGSDVDDTLWFQTVEEDGGFRVVLLPTVFDLMSRFVGPYDADTIRWAFGFAHTDDPRAASLGERVDIEFAGRRYAVHEFELSGGTYEVDVDGDNGYTVYLEDGSGGDRFSEGWAWDDRFETYDSTKVRIVVNSDVMDGCRGFECVPSGEGATSLTLSEADGSVDQAVIEPTDAPLDFEATDDLDPRLSGSLVWDTIVVDGPTAYTVELPSGDYETWMSAWSDGDIGVVIPEAECEDPDSDVACDIDHVGGPIDVLLQPAPDAEPDTVTFTIRATNLTGLATVEASVVQLDGTSEGEPRIVSFDDIPAGPVVVVAAGRDGQDVVLSVSGQPSCADIDDGLSEGEACLVQHAGGSLSVEVSGWSDPDRVGEVDLTVEVER